MPAITSGRVLVTGANGFVAVWVLKYLLERSFTVRGTIRSESKGVYLRELFKAHGDKLELVVVPDITKAGAFDEAVQNVDAILHIASPVNVEADDPNDVILPALEGTKSVLNSALKHRETVKRVVITSSTAAVVSTLPPGSAPRVLDEKDFNQDAVKDVQENGPAAAGWQTYRASKVLAERAAWDFYEAEKAKAGGELGWELTVVAPPFIFGPFVHEASSLDTVGGTAGDWADHVVKGDLSGDRLVKNGSEWVDVRDLAHAQVLALITPDAGGERFIIRGGAYVWQQFVNASRPYSDKIPAGEPEAYDPAKIVQLVSYNAEKSQRILGIRYRTLEQTSKDVIEDFKARGWL
ncbi:NADPH-dependent aldehyde reductase ARI1 [Trametes pubescens]|uniref:NADPH-dependent aldehyde reductase ARI1 n=1 Tax=Trametes pubescens TaxID=154538 RepID=A0A1M2W4U7_TRAPU|nr:NADPH-dependent aldehyde reductase ARI1 [Trametes pubescens]